jgi:hypothetical protein
MKCHMNSLALVEFTWPHQMATKMDLVTIKFDHHHWMVYTMGLITAIRFNYCHQMEIEKGGIWQTFFFLVLVTHKDGWFKKIWSPFKHHNFLGSIARKRGMRHVFKNLLTTIFPKILQPPFVVIEKIQSPSEK